MKSNSSIISTSGADEKQISSNCFEYSIFGNTDPWALWSIRGSQVFKSCNNCFEEMSRVNFRFVKLNVVVSTSDTLVVVFIVVKVRFRVHFGSVECLWFMLPQRHGSWSLWLVRSTNIMNMWWSTDSCWFWIHYYCSILMSGCSSQYAWLCTFFQSHHVVFLFPDRRSRGLVDTRM